tara:strand:+ start:137 stop:367 length:231 start_codon:yes stop_codon:yes gene_type:complete
MVEGINGLLKDNDIMVRIGSDWYRLDEISISDHGTMPIMVSDEDGQDHEFDMADIDEFDPAFKAFKGMDNHITGIA